MSLSWSDQPSRRATRDIGRQLARFTVEDERRRLALYMDHDHEALARELVRRDEEAAIRALAEEQVRQVIGPVTCGQLLATAGEWLSGSAWRYVTAPIVGAFFAASLWFSVPVVFGSLRAALRAALWQ